MEKMVQVRNGTKSKKKVYAIILDNGAPLELTTFAIEPRIICLSTVGLALTFVLRNRASLATSKEIGSEEGID